MLSDEATRKTATDPVCQMKVDPAAPKGGAHVHEGVTYFFCNPRCRDRFAAEPARYLSPAPAPAPAAPAPGVWYVCPMDPEVREPKPGACPKCGMALEPEMLTAEEPPNPELEDMTRRFWVCAALTLPVFATAMADMLPARPLAQVAPSVVAWLQALLATPVVLWGAAPFFARGLASIRGRHANMFTLIALGTGAAYAYSLVGLLFPHVMPHGHGGAPALYFEAAAVITTLVLLGQVLELRARGATTSALRALLRLQPKTARRVAPGGEESDVPLDSVAPGDLLRVRPGETVPADGVVVTGHSAVDESLVTGESLPLEKSPGSLVTGGTLNGTGGLVVRAERVGRASLLAQIVHLVSEAQRTRAPIQRLADRVSGWFVPLVIAISVLTAAAWAIFGPAPALTHALVNGVAVLIIACPCALGLATPMSVMVGTGRGARAGVLVQSAEALETLERVDVLCVDKTGTLTEGKPVLQTVQPSAGVEASDLVSLAASLEKASEHPLATAVITGAAARGLAVPEATEFQSHTGRGLTGRVGARRVAVGNERLLLDQGVDPATLAAAAASLRAAGQTVLLCAIDGQPAGLLGVADPIRPSTPEALALLRKAGVRVVMLTGDSKATAAAIAQQLGLGEWHAEALPQDKSALVARLKAEGHTVAMAGDGVNDAPALALAHVGIAMGTGTDVAKASAGITLLHGDLRGLVRARRLSRGVMRNIRQNLAFAFLYNSLGVPVAAGALYPLFGLLLSPMLASAAMSLSSVCVIGNALRLRRLAL